MKTLSTTLLIILWLLCLNTHAQAPQAISYQAIARNNSGEPLISQTIALRFTVRDVSPAGTIVYRETQSTTTTALGLFTVNVGQGTVVTGTFATINWGSGTKYLQVEMDPANGTSYTAMGTQQMLSVPYALNAANGNWDKTGNNISNSNSGNVGIGMSAVSERLEVSGNIKATGRGIFGPGHTSAGTGFVAGHDNVVDDESAVGGGWGNTANAVSVVSGGKQNTASGLLSSIGGGSNNQATGYASLVSGGAFNQANGFGSVVGGGEANSTSVSAEYNTVSGGVFNQANADYVTVPGGHSNTASGLYSLAAGRRAKAIHDGTFVWGDNTDANFSSTGASQFLIRANSVGIGTNSPSGKLEIKDGDVKINNTTSSASLVLNRNNVLGGTANQIAFQESGTNKWAIGGTNIGGGGSGNFSLYNYNTASNAITVGGGDNNVGIGT